MKIEMINNEYIDIYINPYNFKNIHVLNKDSILESIKDHLLIINNRYKLYLSGFYKIKAYFNKKAGLFLNVIKIDDSDFSNDADFRIILFQNEKFLFEVEDYDIIETIPKKIFYKDKFYVDIDDIENINSLIDMGKVIYGDDAKEVLEKGYKW